MRQRNYRKQKNVDDASDESSSLSRKVPVSNNALSFDFDDEPIISVAKKSSKSTSKEKRKSRIEDKIVPSTQTSTPGSYTAEKIAELMKSTPSSQTNRANAELYQKQQHEQTVLKISGSFKPEKSDSSPVKEAFIRVQKTTEEKEEAAHSGPPMTERLDEKQLKDDDAFVPPNVHTIMLAKEKRERLRQAQLAPDYLPLGGASNLLSQDFKYKEEQRMHSASDSDDQEENMRLRFVGVKKTEKPKHLNEVDGYDLMEDEEGLDSFADVQIKKGVRSLGISDLTLSHDHEKNSNSKATNSTPLILPGVNRFSIQDKAEEAMARVEKEIEILRVTQETTEKNVFVTKENLKQALEDIEKTKVEINNADTCYKEAQEMKEYIADLCDCLKEKLPFIEEMEEHLMDLYQKEEELIEEEEEMCNEDRELADVASEAIHEALAASEDVSMTVAALRSQQAVADKEAQFYSADIKEKSEKRKQRWKAFHQFLQNETYDLKQDPFIQKDIEGLKIKTHMEEMRKTVGSLFSDTLPIFGDLHSVKSEFENWKRRQKKMYSMAYIPDSLPALLAPFVRSEILTWNPFHGSNLGLDSQKWYAEIETYGIDHEDEELMPELVKQVLVPRVRQQLLKCWSPFYFQKSVIAAEMIREMLVYVKMEDAEIQKLLQLAQRKIVEAVERCGIPPFPQITTTISEVVQNSVEIRYHRCLNLVGSISCFHDILPHAFLHRVLLKDVICNSMLPYLRGIVTDVTQALVKIIRLFDVIPISWLQSTDYSREIGQIQDVLHSMCRSLVKQRKDLLKKDNGLGTIKNRIASFVNALKSVGSEQKATELQEVRYTCEKAQSMGRITIDLLRKRSEHNDKCLSTLEEISLHQQNLESIQLLGQLCPRLKILYLQNNLIGRIQNLNKLKDLEYLNLALNNIQKIENLERCESLKKLDLTINFISKPALMSISNLKDNIELRELYLTGNPCADWSGYRPFVICMLPQLKKLDGKEITVSEKLIGQKEFNKWEQELRIEIEKNGMDLEEIEFFEEGCEVKETGTVDANGDIKRPWCPATRILEHREAEVNAQKNSEKKSSPLNPDMDATSAPRRTDFPEIQEESILFQRNEGNWDFVLEESYNGKSVVLDVTLSPYLDVSSIKADIQETFIRLLIKGRLLQLHLPCSVLPDFSKAERSIATGHLLITMPKDTKNDEINTLYIRPKNSNKSAKAQQAKKSVNSDEEWLIKEVHYATIVLDEEDIPPLS